MANHLRLLVLVLFAISASSDVFVSIDCGASDVSTDDNLIVWTGDNLDINNGESKVVQTPGSVSHVMSTLRVFSTRKKNCYLIESDIGGKVLVRASFYYGNYDKKSSPPTFDLHLDGNHWETVVTSIDQIINHEAIYVPKGNTISVCVAQTKPNQLPFISSLEVRSLDSSMYSSGVNSSTALLLRQRVAFGTTQVVRFADDPYDRIWNPVSVGDGLTKVNSDAILISGNNNEDKPPTAVLQSAVTATSLSTNIDLGTNLPTAEVPIYITMYFSEVSQLDSTEKRSFDININNETSTTDPIIPPYESSLEMYYSNMTASSSTSFTLVATSDSKLPPLINAMEVYSVSDVLTDGTNSKDVDALAVLQNKFAILQEWSGDPCLPVSFNWDWVACSSDETPRITALSLNGFGLSGSLPDFSAMDALQTIDMHNNSLDGEIPDFLGTLPNLKSLNLADNDFSGPIPSSLSKNNNLKLVVSGNQNLCVSGKSCKTSDPGTSSGTSDSGISTDTSTTFSTGRGKKKSKLPIILGTTIPSFVVVWVLAAIAAIRRHKRKSTAVVAMSPGQMGGGHGNKPQAMNGQGIMNEIRVEFTQEMRTEFSDATEQQQNNNGGDQEDNNNNNNSNNS